MATVTNNKVGQPTQNNIQPVKIGNNMAMNSANNTKITNNTTPKANTGSNLSPGPNPANTNNNNLSNLAMLQNNGNNINNKLSNRLNNVMKNSDSNVPKAESTSSSLMDKINSIGTNARNFIKNTITPAQNNKPSALNTNADSKADSGYIIYVGIFIAIIILIALYFFSKSFTVGRILDKMKLYNTFLEITNYNFRINKDGERPLKSVSVASSYNACHSGSQMIGYTDASILQQILRCGARYIELNIFSDKYGPDAIPVVDNGYKQGEWKLMLNTTSFESAIKTLATNAFRHLDADGGSPNYKDPIFLALNLSTGYNIHCLDKMADILAENLGTHLLEPKYAYQFNSNIHNIKMNELEGKIVIFASSGYEGSKLEELINGTWTDYTESSVEPFTDDIDVPLSKIEAVLTKKKGKLAKHRQHQNNNRINDDLGVDDLDAKAVKLSAILKKEFNLAKLKKENYQDTVDILSPTTSLDNDETALTAPKILRITSKQLDSPGFDKNRIIDHNKNGLTIIVPHMEGDYITTNYNPNIGWELGCQFVAMNFQVPDENMDTYASKFKQAGIIPIDINQ